MHPVLDPLDSQPSLPILSVPDQLAALLPGHPVVHHQVNHPGPHTLLPQEAKPLAVLDSLPQEGLGLPLVGDGGLHKKDDIHQTKNLSQVDLQAVHLKTVKQRELKDDTFEFLPEYPHCEDFS